MIIGGIGDENIAQAARHTEVSALYMLMMTLGEISEKSRDARHAKTIDHTASTNTMKTTKKE